MGATRPGSGKVGWRGWAARGVGVALGLLGWMGSASAEPQGTIGLTAGVAGRGLNRQLWQQTVFQAGLRGDIMFGRTSTESFGAGPYLDITTLAFDELRAGAGLSTLFPITQSFPIVLSVGGYGRYAKEQGLEPGIAGALFFGTRSYNYHFRYIMTAGLLTQFHYGLGPSAESSILISAQLDLLFISLPFHILYNAIKGGSPVTRPVAKEK